MLKDTPVSKIIAIKADAKQIGTSNTVCNTEADVSSNYLLSPAIQQNNFNSSKICFLEPVEPLYWRFQVEVPAALNHPVGYCQ